MWLKSKEIEICSIFESLRKKNEDSCQNLILLTKVEN